LLLLKCFLRRYLSDETPQVLFANAHGSAPASGVSVGRTNGSITALEIIAPPSPGGLAGLVRVEISFPGSAKGCVDWFEYSNSDADFTIELAPKQPFGFISDTREQPSFYITVPSFGGSQQQQGRGAVIAHFGHIAATMGNTSSSHVIVPERDGVTSLGIRVPALSELVDIDQGAYSVPTMSVFLFCFFLILLIYSWF
jgi:hypothetical protein